MYYVDKQYVIATMSNNNKLDNLNEVLDELTQDELQELVDLANSKLTEKIWEQTND